MRVVQPDVVWGDGCCLVGMHWASNDSGSPLLFDSSDSGRRNGVDLCPSQPDAVRREPRTLQMRARGRLRIAAPYARLCHYERIVLSIWLPLTNQNPYPYTLQRFSPIHF